VRGLTRGFGFAFRGFSYLMRHSDLWPTALLPILINVLVFAGGLTAYVYFFPRILDVFVNYPEVWWQWVVYVLAIILLVAVAAVVVVFGFTLLGCLVAGPFLDMLSERVEKKEGRPDTRTNLRQFFGDTWSTVTFTVLVLLLFVSTQLLLLLLWFVPVVGGILYAVLSPLTGGFLLALEFFNLPLTRRRTGTRDQINFAWRYKSHAVGFGLAVFLTTLVPLLNFLLLPVAAIGATLLVRELENENDHAPASG